MRPAEFHLNIGSNSGDRRAIIGRAVAAIVSEFAPEGARVRTSSPVETEPWGFESENRFVNVGVALLFPSLDADALTGAQVDAVFSRLNAIERTLSSMPHRNPDGSYRDRELDIDLIGVVARGYRDIGRIAMTTPGGIVLPHPRMHLRPFVTIPLTELLEQ